MKLALRENLKLVSPNMAAVTSHYTHMSSRCIHYDDFDVIIFSLVQRRGFVTVASGP